MSTRRFRPQRRAPTAMSLAVALSAMTLPQEAAAVMLDPCSAVKNTVCCPQTLLQRLMGLLGLAS